MWKMCQFCRKSLRLLFISMLALSVCLGKASVTRGSAQHIFTCCLVDLRWQLPHCEMFILNFRPWQKCFGSKKKGQQPSVSLSHCATVDHHFGATTKDIATFSDLSSGTAKNCKCVGGLKRVLDSRSWAKRYGVSASSQQALSGRATVGKIRVD